MQRELAMMNEPFINFQALNDLKGFIFPTE